MLGIKSRALYTLNKFSTTDLHTKDIIFISENSS
jgi:hypothetical protein